MGGVDLSDSALHHAFINRKTYRWFVKLALHFISRLSFNAYTMYKESHSSATLNDFLMIYVRETIEKTGITRKSGKDFTPKQKRSLSTNATDRSPKLITTISQHFSNEIILEEKIVAFYRRITFLGRNDIDSKSGRHKQKRCVLCHMNNIRTMTIYNCKTCTEEPALCVPDCFEKFHLTLMNKTKT
ncbi:unnamed protein product [Rotaria socialis]|uniref:PiggyBac transposable element-derived protein 4 C-terminal zinc-finger domain-containing protein n=1 Tax=Rotaria socialis TaxID=392032 RepID=A0A821FSI1_9BILA|nr:unnamed protein product [Rotaria socialis]